MDDLMGYTPPTPEEMARQRRQQAIYNVQMFNKHSDLDVEAVIEQAKRLVNFVETGE